MEYIDLSHPEWARMWDELSQYKINNGDSMCLNGPDCWEYMGSTLDHHTLQHVKHPVTGKTEYIYIERVRAAVNWGQQQRAAIAGY